MATALSAGDTDQATLDREHLISGSGKELLSVLNGARRASAAITGMVTDRIDYSKLSIDEFTSLLIQLARDLKSHDIKTITTFVRKELFLKKRICDFGVILDRVYAFYRSERELLIALPELERILLSNGILSQRELDEVNVSIANKQSTIHGKLELLLTLKYISDYEKSFPEENSL